MERSIVLSLGAIALAIVAWLCIGDRAPMIEATLLQRGEALLADSGAVDVSLAMNGRDGMLSGTVPTERARADVVAALSELEGLRVLDDDLVVSSSFVEDNVVVADTAADETPVADEVAPLPPPSAPEAVLPAVEPSPGPADAADFQQQIDAVLATDNVEFVTDRAELTEGGSEVVVRIAALLAQQPDVRVEVAGHTDVTGVRELNLALSLARANVVRNQLVNLGIDVGRLETAGYGPDRPIADNDTAEGRARNRRVEFRILERTP